MVSIIVVPATVWAFFFAFSSNVSPSSTTTISRLVTSWMERTCTPSPLSRARSSSSLPRFWVATTSE